MQHVILPFALANTQKKKAVSEITFSVQRPQSQFSTVHVTGLRFMKVYEQERYTLGNFPFSERWGRREIALTTARLDASTSGGVRKDLEFGSSRNPELAALDMLPHMIELRLLRASTREDNIHIGINPQPEYQSTDAQKTYISEDNTSLQSILMLNTNLMHSDMGGFEGTVSCDMGNLGFFNVRDQGHGTTFTIQASMYNFMGQALSEMPSIQLGLLFR